MQCTDDNNHSLGSKKQGINFLGSGKFLLRAAWQQIGIPQGAKRRILIKQSTISDPIIASSRLRTIMSLKKDKTIVSRAPDQLKKLSQNYQISDISCTSVE